MPSGVYERTEKIRKIISKAQMGLKRKPCSEETRNKISKILTGRKLSEENKENIGKALKGKKRKPFTKEWKDKLSKAAKGRIFSEERNNKISKSLIGNKYSLGKYHSEETKKKMSKAGKGRIFTEEHKRNISKGKKGKYTGSDSSRWKGGKSFEPYTIQFNKELKELIRQRDGYQCQICGMPEIENITKLNVHHIDYDKKNCLPSNLITLCASCHVKTNFNREYWEKYFKDKISGKYIQC